MNWGNGIDEEGGQGYSLGQTLKANMERSLSMEWGWWRQYRETCQWLQERKVLVKA